MGRKLFDSAISLLLGLFLAVVALSYLNGSLQSGFAKGMAQHAEEE